MRLDQQLTHFNLLFIWFFMILIPIAHSTELKVGMSTARSGSAQALGEGMILGIETYFKKFNATGGLNDQLLKLIIYDDGYEPKQCASNMRTLIHQDEVLAVIGNVGTPTAMVSVPIANENKTLLFGALSGASILRQQPPDRYVFNYRPSYAEETAAMIVGFLEAGIKPSEIAFFTQNDSYGDDGYLGAINALKIHGYAAAERLAHGRYTRNTLNVENALVTLINAQPKAIIMVGTYEACARFIKMAKEFLPDTLYANVSFVGSLPLLKALDDLGEGVIVTQVVPLLDSDLPAVVEFREDLKIYAAHQQPNFVSLEGYLVAKLFVVGLKKATQPITQESLIKAFEGLNHLDIGIGMSINYSKNNHQAIHHVWPTRIQAGQYVSFTWADLKK